jgi:hypothetical protein
MPSSRILVHLPEALVLLFLAYYALVFLWYGLRVVAFPFPVDYGEGPLLNQVIRLARFWNIYRSDLTIPPYTISNYPPLYLLIQVPLTWTFGPAFWYGRLISLASAIASAVFIALILHTLASDWLAAVIGALVFLVVPYVSFWAPLYRVDSLALALSLAAMLVVVRWPDGRWSPLAAALLLTAAVYTRQSYGLAAPIAVFCWLLARHPRRRAFVFAAEMGSFGIALFVVLNLLTGGGFFFNIVTANVNVFDLDHLTGWLAKVWSTVPGLVVGSALFVLLAARLRVKSWRLAIPYLLAGAAVGLTIGKLGSWVNYLFEFSAATGMAIGAWFAHLRRWPVARYILAIGIIVQVVLFWPNTVSYRQPVESKLEQRDELAELMGVVRETDGVVLTDEHMGLLPLDGRTIYIQPFEMAQLARTGVWDQTPFLEAIARQEFSAILIFKPPSYPLHKDRWSPEALAQIDQYYTEVDNIGETVVYRPK